MKHIAVLVDFTGVCEIAIEHAGLVAKKSLAQLILLHIAPADSKDSEKHLKDEVRLFGEVLDKHGVPFEIEIRYGDFFESISAVIQDLNIDLVVAGTHGIKGIQRNLFSENILKLINSMQVLTLVVQAQSALPANGYTNILVPVLDEVYVINKAELLASFAGFFNSTINVLNFIFEDDEDGLSIAHIDAIKNQFNQLGRPVKYHHESTSIYVKNYGKSIADFAKAEACQLIVWVVPAAEEKAKQFSDDDKIGLVLNRSGIPVLYSPR